LFDPPASRTADAFWRGLNVTEPGGTWWDYTACALLMVVPLFSHLQYQGFGFSSIDAVGLILPYLALGLAAGWLVQRTPPWGRKTVLALLTIAFIDLDFAPESVMPFWIVIPAAFLLAWVLWEHYARIVTVSLLAILAVIPFRASPLEIRTWEAPEKIRGPRAASLVPIVHIILDEHAAPRAFPAEIPEAARARERILEFYRRHGFRLFEKAYSRYFYSHSSIPAMLGPLTPDEVRTKIKQRDSRHFLVTENSLFRWASNRGYRIRVLQSAYIDTCSLQREFITSCRTYPANSITSFRHLPISLPRRLLLEHLYFLSIESYISKKAEQVLPSRLRVDGGLAGMSLQELEDLREQLRENLDGSMYFVHILFPHAPYELDRDCEEVDLKQRLVQGWRNGDIWGNTAKGWRTRWALEAGQVECLYTHLDALVATIDSLAPPQGVMIVFHGDHGSRIVRNPPYPNGADELTDADLIDGFATLLAVRRPGITAGIDSTVVAVQEFVPRLLMGDSMSKPMLDEPIPVVYLQRPRNWGDAPRRFLAPALAR
jgi:hypothetical protein